MSSLPKQQVFIGKHLQGGFCLSLWFLWILMGHYGDMLNFWWVLLNATWTLPKSFHLHPVVFSYWWPLVRNFDEIFWNFNVAAESVPAPGPHPPFGVPLEVIRRPQELEHVGGLNVQGWKLSSATVDGNLGFKLYQHRPQTVKTIPVRKSSLSFSNTHR